MASHPAHPEEGQLSPGSSLKAVALCPQKPTTGLLAITLALHFCDLVHIAGFGYPDSANKKQTIHYYEQITLKSMAVSVCPTVLSLFPPFFPQEMGWQPTEQCQDAEWHGRLFSLTPLP